MIGVWLYAIDFGVNYPLRHLWFMSQMGHPRNVWMFIQSFLGLCCRPANIWVDLGCQLGVHVGGNGKFRCSIEGRGLI